MCGIAGWVDWDDDLSDPRNQIVVHAMGEALAHRGPDESGAWFGPHTGLAHRRLVVVDPEGGRQPMVRSRPGTTEEYVIVYNGELYNTGELRNELEKRGYIFAGHSDTETLLSCYIEWGPECVERLNGIFALAIWEVAAESLFLARDRLGVKPLFYTVRRGGRALLFGSEIKALLAHPLVPAEVDAEGLAEVFALGPGRTPGHGVFHGIEELRPGWWMRFDRQGVHQHQYWRLEWREHTDDLETTAEKVLELLADSVARQLVSDVPLGTLLSGGLDSSAVTTLAVQATAAPGPPGVSGFPLVTWAVDYRDNDRYFISNAFQPETDRQWASTVAELLGTDHHTVIIEPEQLAEALDRAVVARDLPGMADIDSSLYLFSRAVKAKTTVVLSGEAADELFGGYPWFWREDALAAGTFPWMRHLDARLHFYSADLLRYARPREYVSRRYHEALAEVPPSGDQAGISATRARRLVEVAYLSLSRFLPTLLDRKDRMGMAWGLEIRVPFCDHRLVEYVWNIPWEMKVRGPAGEQPKAILRRALVKVLPDPVVNRRKSPYPKTHHPAYEAAVVAKLREILSDPGSPLLPFVDRRTLAGLIDRAGSRHRHLGPEGGSETPWFGQLMTTPQFLAYLFQIDIWMRRYRVNVR